jgi:hypothetical protein
MIDSNYFYRRWYNRLWAKVATVVFVIVVAAVFGNMLEKKVQKSWESVNIGDKLYADSLHLADSNFTQLLTYRRIRPINATDINKKKLPAWKKLKLIAQLDTSVEHNQSLMIVSNLLFLQDDMFKKHTAQIGILINKDSVTAEKPNKGLSASAAKWYAIKPNRKLCDASYKMDIPIGYVLADPYYYVDPYNVSLTEPKILKKQSS